MNENNDKSINSLEEAMNEVVSAITRELKIAPNITTEVANDYAKTLKECAKKLMQYDYAEKEARMIRGEIITSVIDIDIILEEIIIKLYIKEEMTDKFGRNMLDHSSCTSELKFHVVNESGLLKPYTGLRNRIEKLYTVRNIVSHSRHVSLGKDVRLLCQRETEDGTKFGLVGIKEFKEAFDTVYEKTITELRNISKSLDKPDIKTDETV